MGDFLVRQLSRFMFRERNPHVIIHTRNVACSAATLLGGWSLEETNNNTQTHGVMHTYRHGHHDAHLFQNNFKAFLSVVSQEI